MSYVTYLQELLRPLGVYNMSPSLPAGAELEALGQALDDLQQYAARLQQESIILTATDEGLRRMERLFPYPASGKMPEQRRNALSAFLQVSGDSFTPDAMNRCLAACGIDCIADEEGGANTVGISFPGVMGEPEDLEAKKKIIESILPCHLEPIYRLDWCTWKDMENRGTTFADLVGLTFLQWSMLDLD